MKNKNNYSSSFSLKLYNLFQRFPILRNFKLLYYYIDGLMLFFIRKPKYKDNKKKKVLIIYNYAFGDGVIFLNSFKYIKKILPANKYNITLICQKGIDNFYKYQNCFDNVIGYDLTRSTFNLKLRFKLFKLLRKEYYDLVLDPIGVSECTTNIFMSRVIKAREKISILDTTLDNYMCPKWLYNKIYNKIIKVNKPNISLIEFYSEFIKGLGLKNFKVGLEPLKEYKSNISIPKKYFIIFPSASTLMKRWPIEKYAEIAKKIYKETKLPILFCGTNSDLESINKLKGLTNDIPSYDFVNKTNMLEFIELIRNANMIVTNDTSTYHIALSVQTPVTIITGGYTYNKYVLYEFEKMNEYKKPYIVVSRTRKCFNCDNKCKYLKPDDELWPCLNDISINDAWTIIKKMIKENIK